jgi:lipopolysaccharide transport system ATP-binding protein
MSDIAVQTIGLGKMYRIGGERNKYRTLRDTLVQAAIRPIERIRHPGAATHTSEVLWALKDVDLELRRGEALGIIGRNGAGKSTLLKVLSHITSPTEGRVELNGRVGSLLEVGTGFHPELTGRENIQLNGAILGMTRAEIRRKFDEIVEFSEIGRFLDTPVKRYSSGMYVRLAFAVAAHLDPEILIVDEVLSVGDAGFQKKCLGKMEDVAGGGRTILFVSHNMQAVRSLCTRAIQMEAGRLVNSGNSIEVVTEYLSQQADTAASVSWEPGEGPGDDFARLLSVKVVDAAGEVTNSVSTSEPIFVRMEFDLAKTDEAFCIGFDLAASDGTVVLRTYQTDLEPLRWPRLAEGRNVLRCTIPPGILNDGRYFIHPRLSLHCIRWIVQTDAVVSFEAHLGHAVSPYARFVRPGIVAPVLQWCLAEEPGGLVPKARANT